MPKNKKNTVKVRAAGAGTTYLLPGKGVHNNANRSFRKGTKRTNRRNQRWDD